MKDNCWIYWPTYTMAYQYPTPDIFRSRIPTHEETGDGKYWGKDLYALAYQGEFRGVIGLHVWDHTRYIGVVGGRA